VCKLWTLLFQTLVYSESNFPDRLLTYFFYDIGQINFGCGCEGTLRIEKHHPCCWILVGQTDKQTLKGKISRASISAVKRLEERTKSLYYLSQKNENIEAQIDDLTVAQVQ
jgi:hypothetical protein